MLASPQSTFLTPLRCGLFAVALTIVLSTILIIPILPSRVDLHTGAVAPSTIKSPLDVPAFQSPSLTRQQQRQAADAVSEVSVIDPDVFDAQMVRTNELLHWLQQVRDALLTGTQAPPAAGSPWSQLTSEALARVVGLNQTQWMLVQDETTRLLESAREERIASEQLSTAKAQLALRIAPSISRDERTVISDLLQVLVQPNLKVNAAATEQLRKAAMDAVDPVVVSVNKGETIVPDGQILTELHMEKLAAAGLLESRITWQQVVGTIIIAAVLSGMFGLYISVVKPESVISNRRLLLLALILIGVVLAAEIVLPGRPLWAIAFPLALGPMLVTSLLQLSLGLITTVFLAIITTYVADFSPDFITATAIAPHDTLEKLVLYLVTGSVAAIAVWRAQRVSQYFIAGGGAALLGLLVVTGFWLLTPNQELGLLSWKVIAAVGGGLLASALTVGLFVALGPIFDVTTRVQLHELAQPDHPLLKQLLQEAPGTYYHSVLVGNLAEQACEVIGANALLARVGAYYHDIGKTQNPGFFIENQQRGDNIHDRLDPLTSASVIVAHVRDGLRLATNYKLPHRLHDFISEHHGNRLALGFYNKATHTNPKVNPDLFRYPGPAPRSRETGVVMLADSVEAIARSATIQSPEALDSLVERVVTERMTEGQLNECDLTLRDIERIKAVFKSALRGIYHPRVQYPTPAAEEPAEPLRLPVEDQRRASGQNG